MILFPAHSKFSSIGKYYIANYKEITRDRNSSMRNRKKKQKKAFFGKADSLSMKCNSYHARTVEINAVETALI